MLLKCSFLFLRKETDWIWNHMRSEIKSYSNLVDNNNEVNRLKSTIAKLNSETNSMYS